ncbi:MAG: arylsulfatase [Anaerolineales bacterium]|nr:MAG: arylsulfatase [Anaerolineales bacterium]
MTLQEYKPGTSFPGVIGRTVSESSPAWPQPVRAKKGAPNVIFFILDDVGYGQMSAFGGLVNTPNLDRLVQNGLRYTNMHTTALCSPTRACVLTGRNHHSNGVASIMEFATGFPGYDGRMPFQNSMLSEMLLEHGYNTFCTGKWHLAPAEESTPAGPYHRWPLGRGFERFYGFMGGETNQWFPDLIYDNHSIPQPKTVEEGYHLDKDLVDHAIQFILDAHVIAPDKPFFLYHAPGAAHAPHQVAPEWIEKYKGKFDMGWDKYREVVFARQKELGIFPADAELSPHDPDVPEWDTLSDQQKKLYAHFMEVFAGFLEHCDQQFGRLLDTLEEIGELDNTIIMMLPDNGASSEGGVNGAFNEMSTFNYYYETVDDILPRMDQLGSPTSYNHYPWGWSWAGNTPFRRWKKEVYRGGCTDNLIVHWPAGIQAKGENRGQYAHAIDMVPTILEALGITPPEDIRGVAQSPIEGISFAHTFNDAKAATKHHTQYFEMFATRAIDHDGWRAVCGFPGPSYMEGAEKGLHLGDEITPAVLDELDANGWELYHVSKDPAEVHNLAGKMPGKRAEMIARWYAEAGKYQVMPLDGTLFQRILAERPQMTLPRNQYTFYPDLSPVHPSVAPMVFNRPHSITAEVVIPAGGAEGVLLAQGGVSGGYVLYIRDHKLIYVYNYMGLKEFAVTSTVDVPEGECSLRYEFEPTGAPKVREGKGTPGRGQLYINGELVGLCDFPVTVPIAFGIEGLSCGYDFGEAVTHQYTAPFRFTGKIKKVVTDMSGDLIVDDDAKVRMLMAQQ